MNSVKGKLRQGEVVFGQMVLELFTPGLGPMLAASGADFVIYDMEHGRCDIQLAAEMIASCRGLPIVPMVRVPDLRFVPLSRVLDLGARGVMVPRVETSEQAEEIVDSLKYAPQGRRGVALGVAHDLYDPSGPDYFEFANEDIITIVLLESERALENLDSIVAVPGVDVAWIGHYDLTVSMGIPAQFDHPRFLSAMDSLAAACAKHKKAAGFLPATGSEARKWIQKGFRMISMGTDVSALKSAVRSYRTDALA
jgi:2-keto-3-deoxy-L-rhamnonate aldolase RhmA